mmetsp:Transcript_4898/g.11417  ORF Transcript_4898/g.11417 Transcript_4898/m.11417 type:complete len:209 (-) Transcript_4898:933-1559(-)
MAQDHTLHIPHRRRLPEHTQSQDGRVDIWDGHEPAGANRLLSAADLPSRGVPGGVERAGRRGAGAGRGRQGAAHDAQPQGVSRPVVLRGRPARHSCPQQHSTHLPCRFHAHLDGRVCVQVAQQDHQHPPVPAAGLPRPQLPPPCAGEGRQGHGLHRPLRHGGRPRRLRAHHHPGSHSRRGRRHTREPHREGQGALRVEGLPKGIGSGG